MSVKAMSWVWSHSRSKPTQRLVLLAVADCANDRGREAYPSTASLVQKTGLSERGIRKAIAELEELGELSVDYKGGPHGCNRYRVIIADPAPDAGSDLAPHARSGEARPTRHVMPGTAETRHDMPGADPAPHARNPAPRAPEPKDKPSSGSSTPTNSPSEGGTGGNQPASASPKRGESDRPEVEQICRHLADRIEANGSKRPTITDRWRQAARLLIDRDGRTPQQIRNAIDWCQADEFWRANVLSMPKLRAKYDQLRLAAQRNGARGSDKPSPARTVPAGEQCRQHRGQPGGDRDDGQPRCGQCRALSAGGVGR